MVSNAHASSPDDVTETDGATEMAGVALGAAEFARSTVFGFEQPAAIKATSETRIVNPAQVRRVMP